MLSERQIQAVVHEINEDVDLPFVSESREGDIIDKYVRRINPHVGTALEAVCGSAIAGALRTALDDSAPLDERRRRISASMRDELGGPLADSMNERFDATLLTEKMEGEVLRFVVDRVLSQFVTWVIAELDERVEESLAEAAEAAGGRDRTASLPAVEGDFLSEREIRAMVIEINEDVNLPFIGEEREGEIIRSFLDRINPYMANAFESICGAVYAVAVRTALDEHIPLGERRARISALLCDELSGPLSRELNERVDSSMLTEGMEGKVLKIATDKMISQCVKLVVGEIDERIEESLAKAKC